ncbi:MAG: sulfatase [Planctomycetaceae bacterium]|jgi:hypothetical protein|nr:sulfatase [Planctomycetaceae bacterium]MDP7276784.1 DUF1501 domain-containing protein [Planctomycetaceae bacterium]
MPPSRASRRQFLSGLGAGFGSLALAGLLADESRAAGRAGPLSARPAPGRSQAKRAIMLFMFGGPSHIDSFDPKPRLIAEHGRPLPFAKPRVLSFPLRHGNLVGSPFGFRRHGESGAAISEVFPHIATRVDDLCIVNSMHCSNPRHGGAVLEWHTGSDTFIRPSMGSWLAYGLGTENNNLPGYVTICQALSQGGTNNFGSAFLPAACQGTPLGRGGTPAREARFPFIKPAASREVQQRELEMIRRLGHSQLERTGADRALEGRIASFELAFRMQAAAPEVQQLERESRTTQALYGIDDKATEDFGRQCLLARRFSERGVRFVQCNSNGWDHHSNLQSSMRSIARSIDKPIAGLLADLKARGLLDETLVIWGGEFGRTPTAENDNGRDHNPHGFTMWMAGGGVRPGLVYGRTDEYGYYAVENKVHFHDLHATILHLMGFDHLELTFRHSGRDFRLTDVHGETVHDLVA